LGEVDRAWFFCFEAAFLVALGLSRLWRFFSLLGGDDFVCRPGLALGSDLTALGFVVS
jgi:hypothetical protein